MFAELPIRRHRPLLVAVCIVLALAVAPACSPREPAPSAESVHIDRIFAQWDEPDSPGCAVSVARDGAVLYASGYGIANLEHGVPITADSVFHVASVSKQFTAAAIVLLALDGSLALDDDIARYLPELPDFGTRITIRHLLHHTSGLRDQWKLLILSGWRYSQDLVTDDDVLDVLKRQKTLNFSPGEQYLYSNSGYTLLAQIVERVSGQSLRQFTRERLFEPLGMHRTFFRDNFREVVRDQAYGYVGANDTFDQSVTNFDTVGATSLLTTASDLALWARNLETGEIGGAEFLELMQQKGRLADGSEIDYALGLVHTEYRGQAVVEHSGSDAGYTAHFMHLPAERLAVSCLCNTPTDTAGLARRVADVFLPGATPAAAAEEAIHDAAIAKDAGQPSSRTGMYRQAENDQLLEIVAAEDGLEIHNWGMELPLHALTRDRVRVGPYAVFLDFSRAGDGSTFDMISRDGDPLTYLRIEPVELAPTERAAYAGVYVSEEIAVPYEIGTDADGSLMLSWPRFRNQPLKPATPDMFFATVAGTIRFSRDDDGAIDGFVLEQGRVRALEFAKQ